jgi:hypothetical protein
MQTCTSICVLVAKQLTMSVSWLCHMLLTVPVLQLHKLLRTEHVLGGEALHADLPLRYDMAIYN